MIEFSPKSLATTGRIDLSTPELDSRLSDSTTTVQVYMTQCVVQPCIFVLAMQGTLVQCYDSVNVDPSLFIILDIGTLSK